MTIEAVCNSVLLTSAGRRTSLLRAFVDAAHPRRWSVLAGDSSNLAPTAYLADRALPLVRVLSPAYIPQLLDYVHRYDIRLIVPTIDTELMVLAEATDEFQRAGCVALISQTKFVEISGDKWLTVSAFAEEGIRAPKSWLPEMIPSEMPDELFVKPRDGSASQHTYATTRSELESIMPRVPNAIIQERLKGKEITIDAFFDLEGRPIHYVPRIRIRTLGGESIQGVTIEDADGLGDWLKRVMQACSKFGARGAITLQAFLEDDGPVLSEINPRFGGGFPLANAAGGCYPAWLLDILDGKKIEPRFGEYKRGLYMTRYHVEHFMEQLAW